MGTEWLHTMDAMGLTPLSRAFNSGHIAIAELLLRQEKLDHEEKENEHGAPISRAAYFGLNRAVKYLLDGTDPAKRDRQGETPLHKAVRGGNHETVALLVDVFDVNTVNTDGMTPLHWATLRGDLEMANMLVEAGADPQIRNEALDGLTPENLAHLMGYNELSEFLSAREAFV